MCLKMIIRNFFAPLVEMRNYAVNEWTYGHVTSLHGKDVFTTIYNESHWNDQQPQLGTDSRHQQTVEVKRILSTVIQELNCKTILDLPCGDFNWIKDVLSANNRYLLRSVKSDLAL
jgi:hypothetical protein